MALDARATAFVTGAAGFVGTALLEVLTARGHQVFGLTDSLQAAERVRRAGGVPVMGNPLEEGPWQDEAGADWVFHLPPNPLGRMRVTARQARRLTLSRMTMDSHVLDAAAGGGTRQVVYVASATCYEARGPRPATEDQPPNLSRVGRHLAPALDRIEGYAIAGLPIVTAMPGWVYGNGSWLRRHVIEPVMANRPVLQFGKTGPWISPIHVHDCARALVHLAERGNAGGRYFLVNEHPVRGGIGEPLFWRQW
jgi:hypothetical protein